MRLPFINFMVNQLGFNFIIVGFRGYGPSEGYPTESGIKLDVQAIMDYVYYKLSNEINLNNMYIMGRSLGGAVSIYIQSKNNYNIKGLILENTFLSIGKLVDKLFAFISPFKNYLLNNKWDSEAIIDQIDVPIYFVASDHDDIVPHEHMLKLAELSKSKSKKHRKLYIVKGAGHNDSFSINESAYLMKFKEFLNEIGEK